MTNTVLRLTTGYCYDDNGFYLGSVVVDESPADRQIDTETGEVVSDPAWLLPPNVTLLEPPSRDHVFDGQSWVDSGASYAVALAAAKEAKRIELNAARDAAMAEGFDFAGSRFDSDPASVQKINGAVTMALIAQSAGQAFSMTWTTEDNGEITLDAAMMIGLGIACAQRVDELHHQCVALKTEMMALESIEAVRVFVWG